MNLGGWIIGAIVMGAWGFFIFAVEQRARLDAAKRDAKILEGVEREIAALKALGEGRHGRRDAA